MSEESEEARRCAAKEPMDLKPTVLRLRAERKALEARVEELEEKMRQIGDFDELERHLYELGGTRGSLATRARVCRDIRYSSLDETEPPPEVFAILRHAVACGQGEEQTCHLTSAVNNGRQALGDWLAINGWDMAELASQ